jgi:ABC-type xylose transport system permease subunit
MFVALLLIMGLSHILTGGLFLTPRNLNNLFLQTGYVAVLVIGMVLVIIGGQIDLAVGSVVACRAANAALLQVRHGAGTVTVIVVALALGTLAGGLQGALIAYGGIPAFIVTLAGLMFFRGAVLAITGGNTLGPFLETFSKIGSGYLPDFFGGATIFGKPVNVTTLAVGAALILILIALQAGKRRKRIHYGFEVLGSGFFVVQLVILCAIIAFFTYNLASYKGIPYTVIVVATFVVLYSYLTHRTKIGRSIYAVGGNPLAAEMSGINNCMSLLNAEAWLQYMVKGTVLVITVSFDIITRRKK